MTLAAQIPGRGLWHAMRVHPSGVLLVAQLLGIVVYPFTENSDVGRSIFSIIQMLVLAIAVYAVRRTPALNWVSLLLGVPAMVLTFVQLLLPDVAAVSIATDVTHAAFYGYTAYGILRYMFADDVVGKDELFATGACFTVVAYGFAYVYDAVQVIWGPSQFAASHDGLLSWMGLLFLSFTTMTGTGLSDISPIGGHARSMVMMEQLAGVNYLAIVVARLVGLTILHLRKNDGN
ncbi:two pore domain potassium channel family protein [Calidifontibacter sp. DB0510]|uniref:Two pore domain potassium channel family protein n=1 Tax=Metallococcus carri TaxID=1656884 RepID=A0A967B0M7_9MICO|nr:ion channel [Metallococcus carri]NHN56123.1 two pore domain potassium channel family protein [Metallococcus carri]NOP37420.1 two pore domain potassium channel family protein [Calidifontibacter sp. DB2511S]